MTEGDREEYNELLKLFAGISLPGVIAKTIWINEQEIAKEAFDIAEAMIVECKKREKNESNS